ncbi:MAG: transaldolase, partial [Acidobacteria bacterium]|nr:transaldolase [Acidobacteriota bacterium]
VYAADRVFVALHTGEIEKELGQKLSALANAGHPVVYRRLADQYDLGAEFFVWEMAAAVAGYLLSINPFDQPNVQESKDNTNRLLEEFKKAGALPEQSALVTEGEWKIYGTAAHSDKQSPARPAPATLSAAVTEFISRAGSGDYIALLAYIQETPAHDALLEAIRVHLRNTLHVATTTGYGPRFLHSTGQLHKGGPASGIFIQLTDDDRTDLPIPGEPYTFGVLKQAQSLGDFSSLEGHNRRALRVHLGHDTEAGLKKLLDIVRGITFTSQAQSHGAEK